MKKLIILAALTIATAFAASAQVSITGPTMADVLQASGVTNNEPVQVGQPFTVNGNQVYLITTNQWGQYTITGNVAGGAMPTLVIPTSQNNADQAASTTVPTFFTSVQTYFTSFNTNYSWTNESFDAETGYKQVTGVNAASWAEFNYHIGDSFEAVGVIQYSGVGSAINGGELGIGYALNHYDARLTIDLLGGYDNNRGCGEIEPKIEVKKKLSENTYASVGMSLPVFLEGGFNSQPTFWTGLGFSF